MRTNYRLHENGVPPASVPQWNKVARAAQRAGCTERQAAIIARLGYSAANGHHWSIAGYASGLEIETRAALALVEGGES